MARRRRWVAPKALPPALAGYFTTAGTAVMTFIAAECQRRGQCEKAIGAIAAIVGVCPNMVRNHLRLAEVLKLITIEWRPMTAWRNEETLSTASTLCSPAS